MRSFFRFKGFDQEKLKQKVEKEPPITIFGELGKSKPVLDLMKFARKKNRKKMTVRKSRNTPKCRS